MIKEDLIYLFKYKEGKLFRKVALCNKVKVGDRAGWIDGSGYRLVRVRGKIYGEHRVIFMMHHGYLPSKVDHINGNKEDNRIENLRGCTNSQNCQNSGLRTNNTSGYKGVTWHKRLNKFQGAVMYQGKSYHAGSFDTAEEADRQTRKLRESLHGEFHRHV